MTYGVPSLDTVLTFQDDDPAAQRTAALNLAVCAKANSWPASRLREVLDQLGLTGVADSIRKERAT